MFCYTSELILYVLVRLDVKHAAHIEVEKLTCVSISRRDKRKDRFFRYKSCQVMAKTISLLAYVARGRKLISAIVGTDSSTAKRTKAFGKQGNNVYVAEGALKSQSLFVNFLPIVPQHKPLNIQPSLRAYESIIFHTKDIFSMP